MPNYESITFNGIRKDWLYIERGRQKPPFAARRRKLLNAPGYPGGYLQSTDIDPLPINQPVGFRIKDDADALAKKDELAEWLITYEPVALEFDDEPGRIYYAVVQNTLDDFEKMAVLRSGTIQFLCPDPYAYGPEIPFLATSDYFSITNEGTAEAEPIFNFEVNQPITFALIQNHLKEYMMIGRPIKEGDIPMEPYERIANLNMSTLEGWSAVTDGQVLSGGIVGGQMTTTGDNFEASTFGTNPNGWVGPARKRSFSEPLQDFAIDLEVTSRNTQGQTGKLQAILLDAADNEIATMTLIDGSIGIPENRALFTVGNETILNESGENHGAYDNETVHLNLSRDGRSIVAYVYKETGGVRTGRIRRTFRDDQFEHQAPVASIVLYISKYKNYNPFPMSFNHLIADQNFQPADLEIPYIAQPGDIITFDHTKNGQVYINGEPYENSILGTDYFTLKKGENQLVTMPDGALNTSGKYRRRYL